MGYYKDTGSLQSMASAEAILKKRMPEKVGILPVAELLFVAESMWVGEHDMKGHFHPSFRFVKAKRYNAKPHVLIELDGETLADINGRSKYYEGFSRCVDRKPEEGAWIEPTEFGMMFLSIDNAEEYTVPRKTAVRCLETGKMYESIADASRDTGINHNSIRSVARGDRHKAGGYTWEYVNPAPDKRDNRGCNQPTAKKVRCAETGNQFVSLSDAARAVGLRNGNSIRRAIDRGGTAGGYHWEYLDEKRR